MEKQRIRAETSVDGKRLGNLAVLATTVLKRLTPNFTLSVIGVGSVMRLAW